MKHANQPLNRPVYGFMLSMITTLLWGALPIFLKVTLEAMDGQTVTFYRFASAGLIVFMFLAMRGQLPSLSVIIHNKLLLVILAVAGLTLNYVLNLFGLMYVDPETAQVVTQLAPFLLMVGSIVFYKERFNRQETIGALILFTGLLIFFNDKLNSLIVIDSEYSIGVWLIVIGTVAWALYALLQKQLLKVYSAKQITLLIYSFGALSLLPMSSLEQLSGMNTFQFLALIFCSLNTVFAYGAFTEALSVWQASKVSAVIAVTPIFTFAFMALCVHLYPQTFTSSELNIWAYIGAVVVVIGSIVTALRQKPKV